MRPHDFLDYWDTRIEANQQLFDNHPHMANFAFSECVALWEDMNSNYATLLARHNALVEAVRPVVASCYAADADGELDERIDGEMLFRLAALVGEE